jgi:hypothetical protein
MTARLPPLELERLAGTSKPKSARPIMELSVDQLLHRRFVFVFEPLRLKAGSLSLDQLRAMKARLRSPVSPWLVLDGKLLSAVLRHIEVCRPSSLETWVRWRCDRQQVAPFPQKRSCPERLYAVPCECPQTLSLPGVSGYGFSKYSRGMPGTRHFCHRRLNLSPVF